MLGFDELDSTDSFLQGASDEVYMSAIGTDSTAVHVGSDGQPTVDLVNANIVGDVSEDSVRGPWRLNPYVLLEFDLHRTGDWPRSYTATLLIVEKDNQDLANSFSELYEKIGGKIKEAVVSEATTVGAMVGTAIYPGIGTAVGAAIGALAGFGYDAIMPLIREGLGNDVFTPKSITLDIPGPRLIQNLPDVDQPKVVRIEELGAKYDIHYDWHFVDD
ncbi:hypothetical protein ASD68_05320 [Rhodanobacter sp. Root627]|nr:hypothetical protein ASD68_05320 [Rhodanobacter sp. Root627]